MSDVPLKLPKPQPFSNKKSAIKKLIANVPIFSPPFLKQNVRTFERANTFAISNTRLLVFSADICVKKTCGKVCDEAKRSIVVFSSR